MKIRQSISFCSLLLVASSSLVTCAFSSEPTNITADLPQEVNDKDGDFALTFQEKVNINSGRAIDVNKANSIEISITKGSVLETSSEKADSQAIYFDSKSTSFTIYNEGSIIQSSTQLDGSRAIKADKNFKDESTIYNGSAVGSSALISATNSDALRIGSKVTLNNYGTIISTGIVNTKGSNSDSISAYDGLAVKDGRTDVVINNYGKISGPRHGIDLGEESDATITNYANGTIIGNNGSGIGSDSTAKVVNYGTITGAYAGAGNIYKGNDPTSLNGDGDGVDIDGIADITNYGTIQGLGAGGVDSSGYANGSEGIAAGGGTIDNKDNAVIYGQSVGILVDDGANGTTSFVRGTSTATGGVTKITNSGTIEGNTKAAIGLVGDFDDELTNNTTGVIIGGNSAVLVNELSSTTAGAAIQMGKGDDILTNEGSIEGQNGLAIDMGKGDDTLKLLGGSVSGKIMGGEGTDSLVLGGTQTYSTRSFSGFENLSTNSGTTLKAYLGGSSSENMNFSGDVSLANGTVIKPVIVGNVSNGTRTTVLSAGTLTADLTKLSIEDTSALLNFSLNQSEGDNKLVLVTTKDSMTLKTLTSTNSTILNELEGGKNNTALLSSIYNLSTSTAVSKAIKQLTPNTNNATFQAVNVSQNIVFEAYNNRMSSINSSSESGLSAGDEMDGRYWLQFLGNTAQQNSYHGADGYRVDAIGIALGYEKDLTVDDLMGVSVGYTGAKSYGRDESQGDNTNINSFHIGTYYSKKGMSYSLSSAIMGTFNHYNGKRLISISGIDESEKSSYNGYAIGAFSELSFPMFHLTQKEIKPLLGIQYSYNRTESYNESGGEGALHVNASNTYSLKSILGVEFFKQIDSTSSYLIGMRYLHEFANEATTTAGFISSSSTFSVTSSEVPKDALKLSLAYELLNDKQRTVRIEYGLEAKKQYLANQLSLKITF